MSYTAQLEFSDLAGRNVTRIVPKPATTIGVLRLRFPFASEWKAPLRMTQCRSARNSAAGLFQTQSLGPHRRFHSRLFESRPQNFRLVLRFEIVRKEFFASVRKTI